jgi:hypothetical protein
MYQLPKPNMELFLRNKGDRYMENLDRHPLVVKSLTAGCLNALADLICQVFVEKVDTVEIKRLLSFVAIGIFMSGPGLHYW